MDRDLALRELGRRLRASRLDAKLSLAELAKASRLAEVALERYEQGAGNLGLAQLLRVARVLSTEVGQFLHSSRQETEVLTDPLVLLKTTGVATLEERDVAAIASALRRAKSFASVSVALGIRGLVADFTPRDAPKEKPHLAGYSLAREVRRLLPEREGALRNLHRLVEERFGILIVRHPMANPSVLGAAARSGAARVIVLNTTIRYEARRRTVLAHELAHHLVDLREEDATLDQGRDDPFWFENPPGEKRANAFATMLLAPEESVRSLLGPPASDGYGIAEAKALSLRARTFFGLGPEAMAWHLHNLGYIRSEETAKALIRESAGDSVSGFEDEPKVDGLERRVAEAVHGGKISVGRARELLGLSPHDDPFFLEIG